ncbi:RTA1 like protein-domain-containing protein [Apiospora saccharicola]|uniref:RTA1 like protein-domain-containing protein n=1 Tax=Apiospora saccharicola TaxID=335842 RepID=A0ABR1ULX9_9PEZI
MSSDNGSGTAPHRMSFADCTEVSAFCPVEATVLGYYPNLGINAFLCAGFALCVLGLIGMGVWKRTWGYSAALTAGCLLEFIGYIGRVQLSANPFNQGAFQTQICCIILAPTLICISIYLTLKHVTLSISPELSRIRPRLYPLFFVPADVSCLILQAIGGGIAASAGKTDATLLLQGDRVIIAGIALQVVVLGFFGIMSVDYFVRARAWVKKGGASPEVLRLWNDKKFRMFAYAVAGAYTGIFIRCVYRIVEMAGGWGNPIMQDEPSFIVLEGFMILIPVALLTIFTPGVLFPDMAAREAMRFRKNKNHGGVTDAEKAEHGVSGNGGGVTTSGDVTPHGHNHNTNADAANKNASAASSL